MLRFLGMWVKSTFVGAMLLIISSAAMAQVKLPDNLYEALNQQGVATTMEARDLTKDWHIFNAGELGFLGLAMASEMPFRVHFYTKGEMISFGAEKYLVAYHEQMMPSENLYNAPPPFYRSNQKGYILEDSKLALSLLPLDASQSIYEIKQFDPQTDYIKKDIIATSASISNLKQIALATFMYAQDYDETLPPMVAARSADEIDENFSGNVTAKTSVQNRLMPYLKSKQIFLQPATKRPYLPNYKISRMPDSKIDHPVATFLFYEDAPNSAGMRAVAYADGHVKALPEAEFQRQRKAQGISESGYPSAAKPTQKAKAKATPKP